MALVAVDDEILTSDNVTPFKLIDAALAKDTDHVIKEPSWGG